MKRFMGMVFFLAALFVAGCGNEETVCEWGKYAAWDTNGDNYLDQNEFYTAFSGSGGFDRWDVDQSGYLDENEYNTVFNAINGNFEEWDQNNDDLLAENEIYSGLYNIWNVNGDTGISCNEFNPEWATRYNITAGQGA